MVYEEKGIVVETAVQEPSESCPVWISVMQGNVFQKVLRGELPTLYL